MSISQRRRSRFNITKNQRKASGEPTDSPELSIHLRNSHVEALDPLPPPPPNLHKIRKMLLCAGLDVDKQPRRLWRPVYLSVGRRLNPVLIPEGGGIYQLQVGPAAVLLRDVPYLVCFCVCTPNITSPRIVFVVCATADTAKSRHKYRSELRKPLIRAQSTHVSATFALPWVAANPEVSPRCAS